MQERNKRLIEKIRKLIAHERSARQIGNIAEAAAFAERIQALLIEHKLTIAEIDTSADAQEEVGEEIHFTTAERLPLRKRIDPNYRLLFDVIVKNHFCECISLTGYNMIYLIGREADRAVAVEMFSYLLATMKRLCSKERARLKAARRSVRNFRSSFCRGFIGAIATRYETMSQTQDEGTALVLRRSKDEVRAKFEELHPKTMALKSSKRARVNKAALMAGASRGHQVSLATNVLRNNKAASKLLID